MDEISVKQGIAEHGEAGVSMAEREGWRGDGWARSSVGMAGLGGVAWAWLRAERWLGDE